MLHYLFDFLYNSGIDATSHNLFNYISIRSALAIIISLFVTIFFNCKILKIMGINYIIMLNKLFYIILFIEYIFDIL